MQFLLGNQWAFGVFVAVILLSLAEVGHRIGLNLFRRKDDARRSQIGGIQGAVLGLLGLLLGFTFSMAVSRYETRRDLVLKEANAVGTTWLRAGLLPEAHQAPVKDLLRRFVDLRLKYAPMVNDPAKLAEGIQLCSAIETELWQHAEAAAKEVPTPITVTFITALNEMIDTDAERISAGRNRIPDGVVLLLICVAGFGCLVSAYGAGAQGIRSGFADTALPLLITVVCVMIFDISDPQQGFIGISQQPMIDLQKSMQPGPPSAPPANGK
jgi:hypothetical protein